jgi:chromosome segregation ATPase
MKNLNTKAGVILLALVLMIPALSGALAEEKIRIENGQITIEDIDSDKLIMIDTDGLQQLISATLQETLEGMDEVMEELDEMQLEIRLGQDNQLSIETEDQMWEMNLDVILKEVGSVLETALEDMDTETWTHHHHWDSDSDDDEDLAQELKRLKKELRRLQKELDNLNEI